MNRKQLNIFDTLFLVILLLSAISVFAQPSPNADLQRGIELIEAKDYKSAIASLNKCTVIADVAIKSECLQNRGFAFKQNGERNKAIADFNTAVKINPKNAEALFFRGRIFSESNLPAKAAADFTQAIKRNPKNLNSFTELKKSYEETALKAAELEFNAEKFDLALENYTQAIKLNPKSRAAFASRAKIYRKLGKTKLAQADEAKAKTSEMKK